MVFPRQENWSGLPFPSPGNLPDPGIKPTSPTLADRFFTTEALGKPLCLSPLHNQLYCLPGFPQGLLQEMFSFPVVNFLYNSPSRVTSAQGTMAGERRTMEGKGHKINGLGGLWLHLDITRSHHRISQRKQA